MKLNLCNPGASPGIRGKQVKAIYADDTIHSLVKPSRQEIRAAAMPILCQALRNRGKAGFLPPAIKAHMAVNVMHMRAAERGETTRPIQWALSEC